MDGIEGVTIGRHLCAAGCILRTDGKIWKAKKKGKGKEMKKTSQTKLTGSCQNAKAMQQWEAGSEETLQFENVLKN